MVQQLYACIFPGAIDVDVFGLHNNVNPQDVVTLSTDQTLLGHTTFHDLHVTEALNITGRIIGPHMDHILSNPSIRQTNYIQSDCQFQQLIVNGPVFIENTLNDIPLNVALQDVVYSNDGRRRIEATKTIRELHVAELQLSSRKINEIPVDAFMTLNTEQLLQLNTLNGNVFFRELHIDGLFDFVNVTELDENSIKLSGDQYTEAELLFENEISVENLDVRATINDISLDKLIPVDGPITIAGSLQIDGVMITNLDLPSGQLIGSGILNNQDLNVFNATRLSRSRSQRILQPYFVRSLRIHGNLDAIAVNDIPMAGVQQHLQSVQSLPPYLADGSTQITRLAIDGDVQLVRVNGHDLAVIMNNAVWLNRPNRIESTVAFADAVEIVGGLQTFSMHAMDFDGFVAGMVRRDRLDGLVFDAGQTFAKAPLGLQQIDAVRIGNVEASRIFSRNTESVHGLHIVGNVDIDAVTVTGSYNGTNMKELADLYVFDELNGAHLLHHPNVWFSKDVMAGALWLHQSTPNVSEFLAAVVPKMADGFVVTGPKIFDGRVTFREDVLIDLKNGMDLPGVMNAMVMNEMGAEFRVGGDVSFENGLSASHITVDGDIITSGTLMGCDWKEWLLNGIRTDMPWTLPERLEFEAQTMKSDNIQAIYLNDVATEGLITLATEQHFAGSTRFSNVLSNADVTVGGLVNGVDLRQEQANTLKVCRSLLD